MHNAGYCKISGFFESFTNPLLLKESVTLGNKTFCIKSPSLSLTSWCSSADLHWGSKMGRLKFRIPHIVLASSRHPATFSISILIQRLVKFSKSHLLFKSRIPPTISKLNPAPHQWTHPDPAKTLSYRNPSSIFFFPIPHPASVSCPIPHPAKPMLNPLHSICTINILAFYWGH